MTRAAHYYVGHFAVNKVGFMQEADEKSLQSLKCNNRRNMCMHVAFHIDFHIDYGLLYFMNRNAKYIFHCVSLFLSTFLQLSLPELRHDSGSMAPIQNLFIVFLYRNEIHATTKYILFTPRLLYFTEIDKSGGFLTAR